MSKKLVDKITAANASLFETTARLLEAADEVKRDRRRLLQLLRQATPPDDGAKRRQAEAGK